MHADATGRAGVRSSPRELLGAPLEAMSAKSRKPFQFSLLALLGLVTGAAVLLAVILLRFRASPDVQTMAFDPLGGCCASLTAVAALI